MANETKPDEVGLPDLRLPIGLFFIVAAVILLIQAFFGHPTPGVAPIAADANRTFGLVLLVFGLVMAFFGWRAGPEIITDSDRKAAEEAGDPSRH